MKVLLIDNYDSYTYNLYQLIAEVSGEIPIVVKHDIAWEKVQYLNFDAVVISPGPGSPEKEKDFGICKRAILEWDKPIFGVCLGHQGIFHVFGGEVGRAPQPMHGRKSSIFHNNLGIFEGIPQGFSVVRYHSLIGKGQVPDCLQVDAWTEDDLIMGISHKTKPIWGVQFHPESIGTSYGREMIENFLKMSQAYLSKKKEKLCVQIIEKEWNTQAVFSQLYVKDDKAIWLDSSKVEAGLSRFSIIGTASFSRGHEIFYSVQEHCVSRKDRNGMSKEYGLSIFEYLKKYFNKREGKESLPFDFQLGYLGYFGYECKQDCVGVQNQHTSSMPDAYFRYIDRAIVVDHMENKTYLLAFADDREWFAEISALEKLGERLEGREMGRSLPKASFVQSKEKYLSSISLAQELIRSGETYEVCLTNRLDIMAEVNPYEYYRILRRVSPAPYAAFFQCEGKSVACSSMEKFITVDNSGRVETKPIKGTVRRGKTLEEDESLRKFLEEDEKNFAENLMIVDLLRNDLGSICKIGSVRVSKLMKVETYSTVHQLVTTIEGVLPKDKNALDVLQVCFPGGSMTGAPKKRTLEIIDNLETVAREIYSGAIGYLSYTGAADFNIVIRTAMIGKEKITLGVGGAIIALSNAEEEFTEIQWKTRGVLKAFEEYCGMSHEIAVENAK